MMQPVPERTSVFHVDVIPMLDALVYLHDRLPDLAGFSMPASWYIDGNDITHVRNNHGPLAPVARHTQGTLAELIASTRCEVADCVSVQLATNHAVEGFATAAQHLRLCHDLLEQLRRTYAHRLWYLAAEQATYRARFDRTRARVTPPVAGYPEIAAQVSVALDEMEALLCSAVERVGSASFFDALVADAARTITWGSESSFQTMVGRLAGTIPSPTARTVHDGRISSSYELDAFLKTLPTATPSRLTQLDGIKLAASDHTSSPYLTDVATELWRTRVRTECDHALVVNNDREAHWRNRTDLAVMTAGTIGSILQVRDHVSELVEAVISISPHRDRYPGLVVLPVVFAHLVTIKADTTMIELEAASIDDRLDARLRTTSTLLADGGIYEDLTVAFNAAGNLI